MSEPIGDARRVEQDDGQETTGQSCPFCLIPDEDCLVAEPLVRAFWDK